jgi:AcrR family transcriptional regulator
MFDVAGEHGAARVSVAHVVERSGVSRRTFYELFEDREDCFLAAFEEALMLAHARVLPAYEGERKWRERVSAGLVAFLSFLDDEPAVGRLLVCESLSGGPRILERRARVLALVTAAIDEGREESVGAKGLPPLTAEGLVGGALSVIHARMLQPDRAPSPIEGTPHDGGQAGRLLGLANQLMGMIVLPYLGSAAARRELSRPVPVASNRTRDAALLADPFKEAGMRLTYRTVRVLMAIAELGGRGSGPSNRQLGESAGINDQGQISKLLGRLERIGLISNTGLGPGLGAPNAWTLTSKGHQLANSIRAHTTSNELSPQA